MIRTGFIGGALGYHLLRHFGRHAAQGDPCDGGAYRDRSKLEAMFGPGIWTAVAGKVVIDFGCGVGKEAIEFAQHGARQVIGIDIREKMLTLARAAAETAGVSDRCLFCTHINEQADVIISLDAFEHFDDPEKILKIMRGLVKPTGCVYIAFGPTWFHPLGGHLFSVFPWAHLIFTEKAFIRWRSDFKSDGATRFCEVEGGLNQMTIHRFRKILARSEFETQSFEAVPIRRVRRLSKWLPREFFTSIVRCKLVPSATPLGPLGHYEENVQVCAQS
ncbi:MAG: class I SAM-dependent methyltransferase [Nitrospirae bacterium]|nr:MAG: class I SAM-dependent methyltransferase [Nitrospirota bacterium]